MEVTSKDNLSSPETHADQLTEESAIKIRSEAPAWSFDNIAALSHVARTIHVVYVGFLVYCALTIFSTSDRKIILDEQAKLPLLNLDVPFSTFVFTAPLVGVFVFVYFQLHVQILRRAILELRRDFPLEPRSRLDPWMIHLAEEPEIGNMGKLQRLIVHISLWWLLPVVLFLFTAFTFKKHDALLSFLEWLISLTGMILVFWLYNRYHNIPMEIPPRNRQKLLISNIWLEAHVKQVVLAAVVGALWLVQLPMITDSLKGSIKRFDVNLSGEVLNSPNSARYWASLQGLRLQRANLSNTDLTRADLRKAELDLADLEWATLESANLSGASLEGATLSHACLKSVDFRSSDLSKVNLNCADLTNSQLQGANLSGAFLVRADLTGAEVTLDQLKQTKTLFEAILDEDIKKKIEEQFPHLRQKPLTEVDHTDFYLRTYKVETDDIPILRWQADRPSNFIDLTWLNEKRPKDLVPRKEIFSLDPQEILLSRILLSDSRIIVSRINQGYSVAEVRFFRTEAIGGQKSYLRKEELSPWMMVPCPAPDKCEPSIGRPSEEPPQ